MAAPEEPLPLPLPVPRCPFCGHRTRHFIDRRTGRLLLEACEPCSEGAGAGSALSVLARPAWAGED